MECLEKNVQVYSDCTHLDELIEKYNRVGAIVVLDTETTGLTPCDYKLRHKNYILQLSIISVPSKRVLFNEFFKPRIRSWDDAQAVNHISPEMVADKKRVESYRDEVNELLHHAKVVIGYNISFDLVMLSECAGINIRDDAILIDVMEDYAAYAGHLHPYWNTYTWQKLTVACKKTGFDWSACPAHNSLGDCYATLHVAQWLQKKNIEKGWVPYYPDDYGITEDD